MRPPANEGRAYVFGPIELAELLADQFIALGIRAERAPTPLTEEELYSWLSAHASEESVFVHPGLSFWADRPEFPQIVAAAGLFPVSPSAKILSLCLNKLNVVLEAEAAGIPHLAISSDPVTSLREIEAQLEATGEKFPIVLKSMKVAQGHGIQVVTSEEELREVVPIWFEQLTRRYSEASVLIERCLPSARHVIVPFAADGSRFTEVFPTIDASLQTRWRRMLQFIPAQDLEPEAEVKILAYVKAWVKQLNFAGFGSLEFLIDGDRVYLVDATARMNAGFPLWEELCGVRSVEWQLAALGQLPIPEVHPSDPATRRFGAGISLRIYAEDPVRNIPCPGLIRELTPNFRDEKKDETVVWMTRYQENQEVLWTSSGVIGELFVLARDRRASISAAHAALKKVWIAGSVQTNQRFLLEHLEHPFVKENLIHAGFTDEDFVPEGIPRPEIVNLAVTLANDLFPEPGARWISGNQWMTPDAAALPKDIKVQPFVSKEGLPGASLHFEHHGQEMRALFEPTADDRWLVHFDSWAITVRRVKAGVKKAEPTKIRKILALAPGRIHALLRQPGEILQPRDRACMLESIGILVPHAVPVAVRLLEWKVAPGDVVEIGRELALLELLS